MADETPFVITRVRIPPVPLMLLFLYFAQFFISAITHWRFFSKERALLGDSVVNAHIAFNAIGCVLFGAVGSPFLFLSHKFEYQLTDKQRRNCMTACVLICFLLHDFPLWIVEFWTAWRYGVVHFLQGYSLVLMTLTTFFGFFGVWLGYTWKMAKILQTYFGENEFGIANRVTGAGLALPPT